MLSPTGFAFLLALLASAGCGGEPQPALQPPPTAPVAPLPVVSAAPIDSTPPAAPPAPPKPSMADTLKVLFDGVSSRDPHKMLAAYADGATVVTDGQVRAAKDSVADQQPFFDAFPDARATLGRTWTSGSVAVVAWVFTGKNDGPLMGQKATGRPIGLQVLNVFWFDDHNLIKEEHAYADLPTLLSQLDPKAKAASFPAIAAPPAAVQDHVARGTPDEDKNLAAMKSWYDLVNDKKAAAFALLADDVVLQDMPSADATKGRKGAQELFGFFWKTFPDMKQAVGLILAVEDYTLAEVVITGTQKGPLGPFKASNRSVSIHQVDIIQWKDGKATKGWSYDNNKELFDEIAPPKESRQR